MFVLLGALASAAAGAVLIEPWGADSVRVRLAIGGEKVKSGLPGALDAHAPPLTGTPKGSDNGGLVTNGNIQASYRGSPPLSLLPLWICLSPTEDQQ